MSLARTTDSNIGNGRLLQLFEHKICRSARWQFTLRPAPVTRSQPIYCANRPCLDYLSYVLNSGERSTHLTCMSSSSKSKLDQFCRDLDWVRRAPETLRLDTYRLSSNYLTGKPLNLTLAQVEAANNSINAATVPKQDPTATEDCLFLDVMVPKGVFDNAGKGYGAA